MRKPKGKAAKNASSLCLEGEMTIYRAHELKKVLLDSLQESDVVDIDLSAVTELDTVGVQLLILTKREAQAKQRMVRLSRHSPAVVEVFELLNLFPYFGDPLVI